MAISRSFDFEVGGAKVEREVRLTGLSEMQASSREEGLEYWTAYFSTLLGGTDVHCNFYVRDGKPQQTFKSPEHMARVFAGKNLVDVLDVISVDIVPIVIPGYNNDQPINRVTIVKFHSQSVEQALRRFNRNMQLADTVAHVLPAPEDDGEEDQLPTSKKEEFNGVPKRDSVEA